MSAGLKERIQLWCITHDPFAPEGYMDLRRGEKIGERFEALSYEFPGHFATFRGPYYPANEFKVHILIPNKDSKQQKDGSITVYGFYEGTAQCFSFTMNHTDVPNLIQAGMQSLENTKTSNSKSFSMFDERIQVTGVSPEAFTTALYTKIAHQPMLKGDQITAMENTIQLFGFNPNIRDPFFGEKE